MALFGTKWHSFEGRLSQKGISRNELRKSINSRVHSLPRHSKKRRRLAVQSGTKWQLLGGFLCHSPCSRLTSNRPFATASRAGNVRAQLAMTMKLVSIDWARLEARVAPRSGHLGRTFWPWQCRTCVPRPSRHEQTMCFRVSARRHFSWRDWVRSGSGRELLPGPAWAGIDERNHVEARRSLGKGFGPGSRFRPASQR